MSARLVCLTLLVFALRGAIAAAAPPDARALADADRLWQQGQEAIARGLPDEAIARYRASLLKNPALVRNYMSLAAAFLEKGDDATACIYLLRYVETNPAHLVARVHLADLLLRRNRLEEARFQFEACVDRAQEGGATEHLLHCHVRLMEIAGRLEDDYAEHLHRGIGLLLMARQRAALPDDEDDVPQTEGLLCQSAGELTLALQERPGEARPAWYLHQVWSHLDQAQPARKALRAADEAAPFSELTAAEQRGLRLAIASRELERFAK
jgi:tetratricopeptide (TPR) repeat protein